jgi:hypothetical protein
MDWKSQLGQAIARAAKQRGFQLGRTLDPLRTRSVRRAGDSVQTAFWELLGGSERIVGNSDNGSK